MPSSGQTPYAKLPIFSSNDIPTWLGDWNAAMNKIDAILSQLNTNLSGLEDDVSNALDDLESKVTAAQTGATAAKHVAQNAYSKATAAQTAAESASQAAGEAETTANQAKEMAQKGYTFDGDVFSSFKTYTWLSGAWTEDGEHLVLKRDMLPIGDSSLNFYLNRFEIIEIKRKLVGTGIGNTQYPIAIISNSELSSYGNIPIWTPGTAIQLKAFLLQSKLQIEKQGEKPWYIPLALAPVRVNNRDYVILWPYQFAPSEFGSATTYISRQVIELPTVFNTPLLQKWPTILIPLHANYPAPPVF